MSLVESRVNESQLGKSFNAVSSTVPARTSSLSSPNILLSGHTGHVFASRFNRDGTVLASGSFDKQIFLWRISEECDNYMALQGHRSAVLDLAWSSNDEFIFSAGADKVVIIWDLETGSKLKKLRDHQSFVNAVAASCDQPSVFATASDDGIIYVWDCRAKGFQCRIDRSGYPVTTIAMAKDSTSLFSSGIDPIIHQWDLRQPDQPILSLSGHQDTVTGISVSPDGSFLLSNSMDNTLQVHDIRPFCPESRQLKTFFGATHDFEKNLLRCSWSADGNFVTAGSADRFVHIWDFSTTHIVYKLPGHKGSVNDVVFSPVEPIIASASSDNTIFLGELN